MSDIGFHGLGAFVVFGLLGILMAFEFLVFGIVVWVIKGDRFKGFLYSSLVLSALSFIAIYLIDESSNFSLLDWFDNASPFIALLAIIGNVLIGLWVKNKFNNR